MKVSDNKTEIQIIKDLLKGFRDQRDWLQFHDLKNLAEAISIESSELLEHFLWKTREEVAQKYSKDKNYRGLIADELADVIIFCLNFANAAHLDVAKTVLSKMKKSGKKYPVVLVKGSATKYDQIKKAS